MGLIFQIAIGVAVGITLAVLFISFWRQMLAGSLIFIVITAIISAIIFALYFMWGAIDSYYNTRRESIEYFVLLALLIAGPMLMLEGIIITKRFPNFNAFFNRSESRRTTIRALVGVFGLTAGLSLKEGFAVTVVAIVGFALLALSIIGPILLFERIIRRIPKVDAFYKRSEPLRIIIQLLLVLSGCGVFISVGIWLKVWQHS